MTDARLLDDGVVSVLLPAASAANTAAATSGAGQWQDTTPYEGDLLAVISNGAITGSLTGKLQAASDANGTGAVDITGAAAAAATANVPQFIRLAKGLLPTGKSFVGFVGTIVTGPALVGVTLVGFKKYV